MVPPSRPTRRRAAGKPPAAAAQPPATAATAAGGRIRESFMRQTNGGGSLEAVAGFEQARALTEGFPSTRLPSVYVGQAPEMAMSTLMPRAIAPRFGSNLETVIDVDDRVMVANTAGTPWRCICQLIITFGNGSVGHGTGWFAGRRTVITAGHCIIDPRHGEAERIQVIPGRNGSVAPFGFFVAAGHAVCPGWPDANDPACDYGAIFLPADAAAPLGDRLGYFGLASFDDARLDRLLINNAGYPFEARKPYGTLWFNGGRVEGAEERFISYMIDTEGGQSGSPVFFFDNATAQRQVVAIHTTGYFPNRGIRITDEVFDRIASWIDNPGG